MFYSDGIVDIIIIFKWISTYWDSLKSLTFLHIIIELEGSINI